MGNYIRKGEKSIKRDAEGNPLFERSQTFITTIEAFDPELYKLCIVRHPELDLKHE